MSSCLYLLDYFNLVMLDLMGVSPHCAYILFTILFFSIRYLAQLDFLTGLHVASLFHHVSLVFHYLWWLPLATCVHCVGTVQMPQAWYVSVSYVMVAVSLNGLLYTILHCQLFLSVVPVIHVSLFFIWCLVLYSYNCFLIAALYSSHAFLCICLRLPRVWLLPLTSLFLLFTKLLFEC